jgi:16S rRNA G527 N7-methylase RsmG
MIQALIEQLATKEFARDLSNQQLDLLVKHLAAVLEQNKTMNLTSIKSIDQGALLHI